MDTVSESPRGDSAHFNARTLQTNNQLAGCYVQFHIQICFSAAVCLCHLTTGIYSQTEHFSSHDMNFQST